MILSLSHDKKGSLGTAILGAYRSEQVWDLVMSACDSMPVAGVIPGVAFMAHGGIAPTLRRPADINRREQHQQPRCGVGRKIFVCENYLFYITGGYQ